MRFAMRLLSILMLPFVCISSEAEPPQGTTACGKHTTESGNPVGPLSLEGAVLTALRNHPALEIADCEIQASEGRRVQAGLRPNPEVGISIEDFAGSGARSGTDVAQTTLQISQIIELGKKRDRRMALATSELELADWELESQRLAVVTSTRLAFIEVLAEQARLELALELSSLSKSLLNGVAAKVKAGKVSPIEESRALFDVNRTEIAVAAARSRLQAARERLALNWGESGAHFDKALGSLETLPATPEFSQILRLIDRNPALARWPSEMKRRENALQLASAMRVSNVSLSGGVRQFADNDDVGLVIGLSVPLPIFNRNQGTILAAQAEMAAADAGLAAARRSLLSDVHTQYQALQATRVEEESLRTRALPLARRVLGATTEGYRQGKFGLIDVLDAQRIVFESRSLYVEALTSLHRSASQIEGLIGSGLDTPNQDSPPNGNVFP